MKWQMWVIEVILLLLLVVPAVLLVDGVFRSQLKDSVVVKGTLGQRADTLIIYLPGLVADGEWSSRQLIKTWLRFGDVWQVNPTGDRFVDAHVVSKVVDSLMIDVHEHVIIIGSSLGGHLGEDILKKLPPGKRAATKFTLIVACGPADGAKEIKQPLRAVSVITRVFGFGPVTNMTWGKLFTRSITGWEQPRTFAMTYYVDQVRYVRNHPAPDPNTLKNVKVIYLQAKRDAIVDLDAAGVWKEASPDSFHLIVVSSTHAAYDADSDAWNMAFEQAFGMAA